MRSIIRSVTGAVLAAFVLAPGAVTTSTASTSLSGPSSSASEAADGRTDLAHLAHLDFLLDQAAPPELDDHTTYRLGEEPDLTFPWTYAEPRADGTFQRVGGGRLDPETGHYSQGAYNADDISRAAVVYLRHWQQTGAPTSRENAYELLRSLAYLQTSSGPNVGNVVLWIQSDGTLNPSAEPIELPDPSDSGPSYWLARTIWAFGEGYAAFERSDPEFAGFLQDRLRLAVDAVDRQVLDGYGQFVTVDGERVPSWLIVDGADATAEAVLGLSAYVTAAPGDAAARDALVKLSEGVAAMGAGDARSWPYGAILPWAQSRSVWHAWASQMPAALAQASGVLDDAALLDPAVTDTATFTPVLMSAGGPDNGWLPTPTERVQIAYGVDSRLQSLLAVGEATGRGGFGELAVLMAAWYFGANPAGEAMYDATTGRTFDGVQADGSINRNSGAESTIHGLLSMLALDAHPDIRDRALALTSVAGRDGLSVVEAEDAVETTGTVATPEPAWTGESLWSGEYLRLEPRQTARFDLAPGTGDRLVEPVSWLTEDGTAARSQWWSGRRPLGALHHTVGEQGISAVPGALLPQPLRMRVPAGFDTVSVTARGDSVAFDALLVRPVISRVALAGDGVSAELIHSAARTPRRVGVGQAGTSSVVRIYDTSGALVADRTISGPASVTLPPAGFAIVAT
ncbi:hypothetical protein [Phytoactinopolyspora halotolerans]|uniref:Uncharacterized protein n=1 Tax=Phytoactinopolyspora halotolerans TaxID=1981512 RepID=A0A6L9S8V3_9ACTN|nr:hypothetical protein [Phytoactinopolyspora halotolerans]NEE01022.1 hypothetical protein [Phytoactinopolyspora halotolerans]